MRRCLKTIIIIRRIQQDKKQKSVTGNKRRNIFWARRGLRLRRSVFQYFDQLVQKSQSLLNQCQSLPIKFASSSYCSPISFFTKQYTANMALKLCMAPIVVRKISHLTIMGIVWYNLSKSQYYGICNFIYYILMEKKQENCWDQPYTKISSLLFLRSQDKAYKLRMKKHGRMIRRRKYLKQNIYDNNNIFQGPTIKFNRKAAQNIIWEKNYNLKMAINILREQNSSVKARLWNIQKENRKMDKQIQSWNLQKVFTCSNKKPYIDMATVSKVFADQDYEIVSTKIDISHFERVLQQKQDQIQRLIRKSKEVQKHLSHLKHRSTQEKCRFLTGLKIESFQQNQNEFNSKFAVIAENLDHQVVAKNQRIDRLKKNIQLKKKVNAVHITQKQILEKQHHSFKNVNEEEIEKIKQQMRRLKLEQQSSIKDMKKDLKHLKRNNASYQCQLQQQMGDYIRRKIELNKQIENEIVLIQQQLGDTDFYKSTILPAIKKLEQ